MGVAGDRARGTRVAVLGIGIMGSAMARNLLAAGLPTAVWDRSATATARLAEAGAVAAPSAADAVRDARVVITMLPTSDVVTEVIFDGGVAGALSEGAVWAQMGTIGAAATAEISARLGRLRPDVMFVDAPVSGSKGPAEQGQLLILASGPPAAEAVTGPVFSAIGRKTVWLGKAGQGSQMKLAVNAYMSILIEGVAEALELATRLGVDTTKLAEAIEGGPLDAPIADAKLHKMERGDYAPEFPLQWALKDVDLALEGAPGATLPLLAALSRQWRSTVDAGHGREDVSVARLGLTTANRDKEPSLDRGGPMTVAWDHVSRTEVLRAIQEYDRLGPEAFFSAHGFAPTTTYDLLWEERRYPPKAILGTAYEFATGQRLASGDFEGGKSGAVRVLENLGFTVHPRKPVGGQ